MCNWWSMQQEAPYPLSRVIDSLVIIHDELSPQHLATAYWCSTGDYKVREEDFLKGRPRDSFAGVVARRANGLRKILQKLTPLEADFYVSP